MKLPKEWTDLDWRIYDERITKARTWRQVGEACKRSHEYCRKRLSQRFAEMPHGDVDAYRMAELERLDTREHRITTLYAHAVAVMKDETGNIIGPADPDTALKAMKQLNDISRLRIQLLGLARPVQVDVTHSVVDTSRSIVDLIEAYTAGAGDAVEHAAR